MFSYMHSVCVQLATYSLNLASIDILTNIEECSMKHYCHMLEKFSFVGNKTFWLLYKLWTFEGWKLAFIYVLMIIQ